MPDPTEPTRAEAIARLNDRCRLGRDPTARLLITRMGAWIRLMHRLFALKEPSSDHLRRTRETARELTIARIRECRHEGDLARVEQMLVEARSGWLYGLDQAFTRAERGELLVEVRNRRRLIAINRTTPKAKGPRFDTTRLPMNALERLIQSHSDPALVDMRREERNRRLSHARIQTVLTTGAGAPMSVCHYVDQS